jgi:cyclopropane fatty-acyl-phospholipid synthase-like methyltransferase
MWDVIGPLQFEYLRDHGLAPNHRMLDIGCGTLRGGRHFIRYLETGCYTGFDISSEAIALAKRLVVDEGLVDRRPQLVVTQPALDFAEFAAERYDVLLAQSVFTHLPAENIAECFAHVGTVLADGGMFWFTFHEAETATRETWKDFRYPFSFFTEHASHHGFRVELMSDYSHPRNQKLARLTLAL